MRTEIHSQPIQFELSATMTLPVLLLCLLALIALVAADGPGGYISPWSMGGNMTTIPHSTSNGTKGLPYNLIISNKSDLHTSAPPAQPRDYFISLGYGAATYRDLSRLPILPLNDTVALRGPDGPALPRAKAFAPECKDTRGNCLQFSDEAQEDAATSENNETTAVFIAAVLAHATADGVKVAENGYDLARDQLVARATSSYSGEPIIDHSNKNIAYKTTVVYNDTELLSNVSASDLRDNISTDRRVPILLVEVLHAPFNESTKSYPGFESGAASGSLLSVILFALCSSMAVLIPLAF